MICDLQTKLSFFGGPQIVQSKDRKEIKDFLFHLSTQTLQK